ncbi:MAG: glycosyltransferase family 2 protein [Clostridium fessum]
MYTEKECPLQQGRFAFWLLPRETIENGWISFQKSVLCIAGDADYCCRILQAGYIMLYCDECIIYHKISASNGVNSPFNQYYMTRNGLYIIEKYSDFKFKAYLKVMPKEQ